MFGTATVCKHVNQVCLCFAAEVGGVGWCILFAVVYKDRPFHQQKSVLNCCLVCVLLMGFPQGSSPLCAATMLVLRVSLTVRKDYESGGV